MTQYSYPWTAIGGDRTRTADTAAGIYDALVPTGVLSGLTCAANGANVDVAAGVAMVDGRYYQNTATVSIAYTANVKAYIVLRLTAADRAVVIAKLDGNSSAFPTLTQTAAVYEIALCSVDTTSGVVVADTRKDTTLCGLYANPGLDSGWLTSASGGFTVRYRKLGSTVHVEASYAITVTAGSSVTYTAALPAGFRPTYDSYGAARGSSTLLPSIGHLTTSGNLVLKNTHTAPVANIAASFCFAI